MLVDVFERNGDAVVADDARTITRAASEIGGVCTRVPSAQY
jgi:hypothetical protein